MTARGTTTECLAAVDRLPMPDWGRPGETWAVEPDGPWDVGRLDVPCGRYLARSMRCHEEAVVRRRNNGFALCDRHLREFRMWVEDGIVVSWRLAARQQEGSRE